ncbi:hypothetical protein [Parenemella sanctibonifatiensis]|uniref:Type IV secretion system protein n=1 Tax=Parenemella sanctibonifatiensis TaxID=2016505 RepID=A0A255EDB1_9ACTN|nr:hypothetical protein [Parenemella sanctibonifatiensis]OYN89544.1 hypothetical protein CGZ91_11735 [Parenemella sanctibonifatiensis]
MNRFRVLAALLLTITLGMNLVTAAAHAAEAGGQGCSSPNAASLQGGKCPPGGGQAPPGSEETQPPKSEESQPPKSEESQGSKEETPKKPYAGENPADGPGQWGKAGAEAAQGQADYVRKELRKGELVGGKLWGGNASTVYAAMWALGCLLAAVATIFALARLATGAPEDRVQAQQAGLRLMIFAPLSAMIPMLGLWISDMTAHLGGGMYELASNELAKSLDWIVAFLGGLTATSVLIPGGSAVVAGLTLFFAGVLTTMIVELLAAKFVIAATLILLPVLFAMWIYPPWQSGVKRAGGVLLGAWLTPAALFFVWAAAWQIAEGPIAPKEPFIRFLTVLVGILVSLTAPVAAGMILSHIPGAVANLGLGDAVARTGGRLFGAVKGAQDKMRQGVQQAGQMGRSSGGSGRRPDRAQRATNASEISSGTRGPGVSQHGAAITPGSGGSPVGAGTGAGAGVAGAAGPAGLATQAAEQWNKTRRGTQAAAQSAQGAAASATQSATSRGTSAAGEGGSGGDSPGPGARPGATPTGGRQSRLPQDGGTGGSRPTTPASSSGAPSGGSTPSSSRSAPAGPWANWSPESAPRPSGSGGSRPPVPPREGRGGRA